MSSMLPIWILPFWTLGVPLIWAIAELMRMPRRIHRGRADAPGVPYAAQRRAVSMR